jgi:hypothetical protein
MSDADHRLIVPPHLEAGTYSNMVHPWHTAYELTLDFAVLRRLDDEHSEQLAELVARVHIPATMAFNVITSINDELTKYEQEFGEVRGPDEMPGAS